MAVIDLQVNFQYFNIHGNKWEPQTEHSLNYNSSHREKIKINEIAFTFFLSPLLPKCLAGSTRNACAPSQSPPLETPLLESKWRHKNDIRWVTCVADQAVIKEASQDQKHLKAPKEAPD